MIGLTLQLALACGACAAAGQHHDFLWFCSLAFNTLVFIGYLFVINRFNKMALASIMLFVRSTRRASHFYQHGLGLPVISCDDAIAHLNAGAVRLTLKASDGYEVFDFTV